jgi:hypothetical protein
MKSCVSMNKYVWLDLRKFRDNYNIDMLLFNLFASKEKVHVCLMSLHEFKVGEIRKNNTSNI